MNPSNEEKRSLAEIAILNIYIYLQTRGICVLSLFYTRFSSHNVRASLRWEKDFFFQ